LRAQAAQRSRSFGEDSGGVAQLAFDDVELRVEARVIGRHHQIQEIHTGFNIAERLAQVVNQFGEQIFVSGNC
jgi:hypothetical protein